MDELRSLEGTGILLQMNNNAHDDTPQINRASSSNTLGLFKIEEASHGGTVINNLAKPSDPMSRAFTTRGVIPVDFVKDINQTQESSLNLEDNVGLSRDNTFRSITSQTDTSLAAPFGLAWNCSTKSLGIGAALGIDGLEMDDIGFTNNDDDEDSEWHNDHIINLNFQSKEQQWNEPQLDIGNNNKLQIELNDTDDHKTDEIDDKKQNIDTTEKEKHEIKDDDMKIDRFPIEEFKNYPVSSIDNAENGSVVPIIGSGAFGIVIKAFHLPTCKTVAIKQCRISDEHNKYYKEFIRESICYKAFSNNDYIVDILGFGMNHQNNKLCIALEYMDLQSISRIKSNLSEEQIKYVAYSILCALVEIHDKLYIHNDIKPDNILINSHGNVKLSDFGCCFQMDEDQVVLTDNICGSKQYYPPEKWLISPPEYNQKSDIWSLGITLYEIITMTMHSIRENGFYKAPILEKDKYSANMRDFIAKMLIFDFKDRYSGKQLLNHPFLETINNKNKIPFSNINKKESDLEFMVASLIEFYSNKNFYDEHKQKSNKNGNKNSKQYTDKQKIENLCKYSGCTENEVMTMIKVSVGNIKKKIDKIANGKNINQKQMK